MKLGFSLIELIKTNPTSLTIYFGGAQGRALRARYLSLARHYPVTGKAVPGLDAITPIGSPHAVAAPAGLRVRPYRAQPAIRRLDLAQRAGLQPRRVGQEHARFAGHTRGRGSALGASG